MKTKKQKLRDQADELWGWCVVKKWGQDSVVSEKPAQDPHHFFPKGKIGHLRYNLENGCPLTRSEHIAHHWAHDPRIHAKIIEVRGWEWYNKLEKISRERHENYITEKWYMENIARLQDYLEQRSEIINK